MSDLDTLFEHLRSQRWEVLNLLATTVKLPFP
jgi:hypothetical protein